MSAQPVTSVAEDFSEALAFLQERGIVSVPPPQEVVENARRIHSATYSLILWRFRLRRLPTHGQVFIEEIASDALQILPQIMMGYSKTARLLTRGIVENTLRHLYFSDHPVEFEWMNRDKKWHIKIQDLFEYARSHPIVSKSEERFDAINRLSALYSELSEAIHGRRVQDLEMRLALSKIKYADADAKTEARVIRRCAESCNFVLALFHRGKMAAFQTEDRRIILRSMPPQARRVWKEWP
jgi:hypothetical protein